MLEKDNTPILPKKSNTRTAQIKKMRHALTLARKEGDVDAIAIAAAKIARLNHTNALDQRVASQSFLAANDIESAVDFAERACLTDPDHYGHRLHCGGLKNRSGDYLGAIDTLTPLFSSENPTPEAYIQTAQAVEKLGEQKFAIELIQSAIDMNPERPAPGMILGGIYARAQRWSDAIDALTKTEARTGVTAVTRRSVSGYYAQLGNLEKALGAIDEALGLDDSRPEYRLHRLGLLQRLSRTDEALEEIERLLLVDPTDLRLRRRAVSLYVIRSDLPSALEHGAQLVFQAPENEEFLSCMAFLLEARKGKLLIDEIGDIASLKRGGPPRSYRSPPRLNEQIRSFFNVIWALILREVLARHGRNRLGFFWSILEPVVHIAALAALFQFIARIPPLGDNFFLFYFTGIAPFLLMSRVANEVGNSVIGNRNTLQIPHISPLELALSKLFVEMFIMFVIILIFGGLFMLLGWATVPAQPEKILTSLLFAAIFGFGIGTFFASATEFSRLSNTVSFGLFRVLYLTGGIFFIPASIPQPYRDMALWNPFLHIVSLMRDGTYPNYAPRDVDPEYTLFVIILTLGVGLVMIKAVTPLMRVQK